MKKILVLCALLFSFTAQAGGYSHYETACTVAVQYDSAKEPKGPISILYEIPASCLMDHQMDRHYTEKGSGIFKEKSLKKVLGIIGRSAKPAKCREKDEGIVHFTSNATNNIITLNIRRICGEFRAM